MNKHEIHSTDANATQYVGKWYFSTYWKSWNYILGLNPNNYTTMWVVQGDGTINWGHQEDGTKEVREHCTVIDTRYVAPEHLGYAFRGMDDLEDACTTATMQAQMDTDHFYSKWFGPCGNCGQRTNRVELNYEMYLCSHECDVQFNAMVDADLRKLDRDRKYNAEDYDPSDPGDGDCAGCEGHEACNIWPYEMGDDGRPTCYSSAEDSRKRVIDPICGNGCATCDAPCRESPLPDPPPFFCDDEIPF